MNGILNILKPPAMTSFDVVAFVRKITRIKKVGHGGTLDPLAVGVLPIFIGNGTKTIEYIMNGDKKYRVEMTLGSATDTQDKLGEVIFEKEVNVSENDIIEALKSFKGEQKQCPPMFSAIKVNGEKLYDLARKGIVIDRELRDINVYDIKIVNINNNKVLFDVHCSKGAYMRTICHDIGVKLGCGAYMSFLLRTKSSCFELENSITLEELSENKDNLEKILLKPEVVFENFESIIITEKDKKMFQNGGFISKRSLKEDQIYQVKDISNVFLGLGKGVSKYNEVVLKVEKLF